jgi:hypothetical protein
MTVITDNRPDGITIEPVNGIYALSRSLSYTRLETKLKAIIEAVTKALGEAEFIRDCRPDLLNVSGSNRGIDELISSLQKSRLFIESIIERNDQQMKLDGFQ